MTFLVALALPLLALRPHRQHEEKPPAHACQRVRMRTDDGREGWDCPCRTGPHRVLGPDMPKSPAATRR